MAGKTPAGFTDSFFQNELKAYLPEKILDFHTHVWQLDQWNNYNGNMIVRDNTVFASAEAKEHQKYMSTTVAYSAENLLADGAAAFPGLKYHAVIFGRLLLHVIRAVPMPMHLQLRGNMKTCILFAAQVLLWGLLRKTYSTKWKQPVFMDIRYFWIGLVTSIHR